MIIDLMIIFPVITLCVLGFRDGIVKKGIALLVTFIALIVAQLVMNDVAEFYIMEFDLERVDAVIYGFYSVFFGLIFVQSLTYRLTASEYKIGGIADRVVGSGLGLLQGLLIVSVIFMMLSLTGFPSRQYRTDSRLYKAIINIAPQLLDFTLETVPEATRELKGETKERLDEFTKPDTPAPAQKK
ncbi:MAG: CvpA family protein [Bacteroidota bacterium]